MDAESTNCLRHPIILFPFFCLLFQIPWTSSTQETLLLNTSHAQPFFPTTQRGSSIQTTQETQTILNEEENSAAHIATEVTDIGDSHKPRLQALWASSDNRQTAINELVESAGLEESGLEHTSQPSANLRESRSSAYQRSGHFSQLSTSAATQREGCRETPPFMLLSHFDGSGIRYQDVYIPLQSSCNASMPITENIEQMIEWGFTYNETFSPFFLWYVTISEGYGFVVDFDNVKIEGSDYLEIFNESTLLRNFTQGLFSSQLTTDTPLFLSGKEMSIILHIFEERSSSHVRLRYTARLNEPFPETVYVFDDNLVESHIIVYCSGIREIPNAIMCDGVQHCENDEDEKNCSYRQEGCGDWFPYKDHCLKAKFETLGGFIPSHTSITMPHEAEEYCRSEYGATLASLPDPVGIDIAAKMLRVAGFRSAVVGIQKIKPVKWDTRQLLRHLWQWGDRGSPIAYEQQQLQREGTTLDCGALEILPWPRITPIRCIEPNPAPNGIVCMKPNPTRSRAVPVKLTGATFPNVTAILDRFPTKECPDGSVVQVFHSCQWGQEDRITSTGRSPGALPLFKCRLGHPVHYSLVCDGISDCADRSDELHCKQPQFYPLLESSFICRTFQIIPVSKRCDGNTDCFDESDEEYCTTCTDGTVFCLIYGCLNFYLTHFFDTCPSPPRSLDEVLIYFNPAFVKLDGLGMSTLRFGTDDCGEGYFRCKSGLCVPTFLINNGEKDCYEGEDEDIPVHNMLCPGYYRCQDVGICVHPRFVCDNIYHCPNKDDEMFCDTSCPSDQGCTCEGQAYTCSQLIDPLQHLHVRYLDFSHGSGTHLDNIHFMEYLSHLNLSCCQLSNVTLADMPHLLTLDLSYNHFTHMGFLNLTGLTGLLHLNLSNNPFVKTLNNAFTTLVELGGFIDLRDLVMVDVSLEVIEGEPFTPLSKLEYLDIRGNSLVSYGKESLSGLTSLSELYTDEFKLCCSYFHFSTPRCYAPEDELSSCSDLLAKDFFRVFLWILSVLAIVGNAGVLIYRLVIDSSTSSPVFRVMVKNLCASDLLMGVYMMMIGVADARLKGQYVAEESEWTSSVACTVAGFLSFVSSEVSAFIICLITLDRVLVISFPLHTRLHLTRRLTISSCCLIWFLGVVLAAVPILTRMEFYGQNGVCVPLPITRRQFSGQSYAFGVFIVLNFVIFVFIGLGQLLIYRAVRRAGAAAGSNRSQQDMTIARRLFLVIFTDFCCWFPIGVFGLLASSGTPISGSVNAWAAIFVLPLNSALNPFLYTLNSLMEQWKKRRAEQRIRRMLAKLRAEILKWQPSSVQEVVKICAQSKVVSRDALIHLIGPPPQAKSSDESPPGYEDRNGEPSEHTENDGFTESGHCYTTESDTAGTK